MENEKVQSAQCNVTERDIYKINDIFVATGVSLPISYTGRRESWQLPVTEEFLAGINAQRKRLQTRNLQIHRQSLDWAKQLHNGDGNMISPSWSLFSDGNYQIGRLRKRWQRITTYLRGQRKLTSFKNLSWIDYYVKKEPGEESMVSTMYTCGTWEFFGRAEEYRDMGGKLIWIGSTAITISLWLVFALVLFIWMLIVMGSNGWMFHFVMLQMTLFFGMAAGVATRLEKKCSLWRRWRMDSRKVTARIREKAPEFCLEMFISVINSKLLRLLFADGTDEIGDIVSCDMSVFLQNHKDVVNCEIHNFWFTGFREDQDYMYLDVTYRVSLERDLGERIGRSKETIMLLLARPLQGIMAADLYQDWSVVKIETR